MKKYKKRVSLLLAAAFAMSLPMTTFTEGEGSKYSFSVHAYGPGVQNLSSADYFSQYQWGLKNDAELQYQELRNVFADSNPRLAREIDISNWLGLPAPVAGPSAYEILTVSAVKDIDINIQPAWELYDSSTDEHRQVIVAVIDTGIDVRHPELQNAMWVNAGEIPGDGIDNDGNGYVDDVYGWNFFHNNNQVFVGEEDDHGTHAAGTIAAERGGVGIAGITDNNYVKIMSLKALGSKEGVGEEAAVIEAIRYAEANGASICNLSFGTTQYYPGLEAAMRDSNMLFVISAGNGDQNAVGIDIDRVPDYPSSYRLPNAISVANLMFDGNLDVSSNYGVNTVDIAAPGTYILSTVTGNQYGFMSGTSMSAPMVTGVAAMVYSYRTDLSLSEVRAAILNSAHKLQGLEGKLISGGMLDAYAALTYGR